ncbi:hypothetical protein ACO0QE_003597 [Hanseniaspora vineae]
MTADNSSATFTNHPPQPNTFLPQQTKKPFPEAPSKPNSSLPQNGRSRYLSIHELTNDGAEPSRVENSLTYNVKTIVNQSTETPIREKGTYIPKGTNTHKPENWKNPVSTDPQIPILSAHDQKTIPKDKTNSPVEFSMLARSEPLTETIYSQPKTKRYKTQLHPYKMAMAQQTGFYRCSSSKSVLLPIGMQSINKCSPRLENVYDAFSTSNAQKVQKLIDSKTGLTYMLKEGYVPFFELDEDSKYIENPILFYEDIRHLGIKYGAIQVKTKNSILKNNIVVNNINEQFKIDLDSFQFKARHSIYNDPQVQIEIVSDFYEKLYEYYKTKGIEESFNKFPTVDKKPLDLWRLWCCVQIHGGFEGVCYSKMWLQIGRELGYSGKIMQSLATTLRSNYLKIFGDFTYTYHRTEQTNHTPTTTNSASNSLQNTKLCTINTQHKQNLLKDLKILESYESEMVTPNPYKKRKFATDSNKKDFESYYWHEGAEEYADDYYINSGFTPLYTIREMVLKNHIFSEFLQKNFGIDFQVNMSADDLNAVFQSLLVNPKFFYGVNTGYQVPSKFKHRSSTGFWNIKKLETAEQNLQRLQPVDFNNTHGSKYDITMMLSYDDWSCKNSGFPTIDYLEYGASKVWHVIPQSETGKLEKFQASATISGTMEHVSASHNDPSNKYSYDEKTEALHNFSVWSKPYFENCISREYISPNKLNELGIKNFQIVQTPGTCVFTFDHAMTSKIASGFSFSETISFATESFFDQQQSVDPLFMMNVFWNGNFQQMEWAKHALSMDSQTSFSKVSNLNGVHITPQTIQKFYYDIDFFKNMSLADLSKGDVNSHYEIGQMLSAKPYLSEDDLKLILSQFCRNSKNTRDWQKISKFFSQDLPMLKRKALKFSNGLRPITFVFKWGRKLFLQYGNVEPVCFAELQNAVQYLRNCPVKCLEIQKIYDTYNSLLESMKALNQMCNSPKQDVDLAKYHHMLTRCLAHGVKYDNMQQHCQFYQKIMWFESYKKLMNSKAGTYSCEQIYELLEYGAYYDVESEHLSSLSDLIRKSCKINERIDHLFKKKHTSCMQVSIDEIEHWLKMINNEKVPVDQLLVDLFEVILDSVQSSRSLYQPLVSKMELGSRHIDGFTRMINNMEWDQRVVNNFLKDEQRYTIEQVKKVLADPSFGESKASNVLMTIKDLFFKEIQKSEKWLEQALQFFKSTEHLNDLINTAAQSYAIEHFEQLQFAFGKATETAKTNLSKVEHNLDETVDKKQLEASTHELEFGMQQNDLDVKRENISTNAISPEVYCYCRKGDNGSTMVACEICQEWYHVDCVTNVNPANQTNDPDPVNNLFLCSMCFGGGVNFKTYDGIQFPEFQKLMILYGELKIVPNETLFVSHLFRFYQMALDYRNRMVTHLFDLSARPDSNSSTASETSSLLAPNATKFILKADVKVEQCKYFLRKAMGGHCYFLAEIKSIRKFLRKTDLNAVNRLKRKKIDIVTGYPLSEQPFKDNLHFLGLDEDYE